MTENIGSDAIINITWCGEFEAETANFSQMRQWVRNAQC